MLKQLWRTNAPLTFTGLLMLPALAIAIAGLLLDLRMITDAPAWLSHYVSPGYRTTVLQDEIVRWNFKIGGMQ